MDAVRFGRALGFGARQAAKTVISAVNAASAENPTKPPSAPSQSAPANAAAPAAVLHPPQAIPPAVGAPTQRVAQAATQARGVREGLSRFRDSTVEPAVRLSAVLWLEVTGVFFALFALAAANGVWRLRAELRPALTHPLAHAGVLGAAAIFILFAYFSISSFVRARRRQRRRD